MMIERDSDTAGRDARSSQDADDLPYWIELWTTERERVERVLGRAASAQLARAIFNSAQTEFPARRVTVRRGEDTVLDTEPRS